MKGYGLWFGGESYTAANHHEDLELFVSLAEAKQALIDRYASNGQRRVAFHCVNRDPEQVFTPAVTESSEIHLYASADDLSYSDRRVFLGPRGGARIESC